MHIRDNGSHRRGFPFRVVAVVVAVACLFVIGIVRFTLSRSLTCPSARVELLRVTAIPGGMGHSGVVVRALVTSPSPCMMSGYPVVGLELTNHSTAVASYVRMAYLGGFESANGPLPRISITSHAQVVSFTIQSTSFGDPPTCPEIKDFQVTLPGSRGLLTARSMYEAPMGLIQGRGLGFYCGNLQVTPLVKGSSGSGS